MTQIHEKAFDLPPGWRPGQFIFNFLAWLHTEKGYGTELGSTDSRMADPFGIERNEWNKLVKEYLAYLNETTLPHEG